MSRIILDCDLMKFPHSGLYHYCQNLAQHINSVLLEEEQELMRMYLPPKKKLTLTDEPWHRGWRNWHKFLQRVLLVCQVWFSPFMI